MTHALQVENVSVHFGATQALSRLSFGIEPGEVRALIGANGAGKSTLIKTITGVVQPTHGKLWRDGASFSPSGPQAARGYGIHAVNQELTIFPHLSVLENIFAGAPITRARVFLNRTAMREAARAALSNLGHEIPLDIPAGRLSVSNQQIVEIVRATIGGARVLLLDEPTSSLGADDRQRLFTLVRTLAAQGCAVIFISHFLDDALEIADTFTVVRDGSDVISGGTKSTNVAQLSEAMFGRQIDLSFERSQRVASDVDRTLLELERVSTRGVHEASFKVQAGEVVSIFGLVDCGAYELLQAIFGLRDYSGEVRLPHLNLTNPLPARWRRHGIGMVAEERPLNLAGARTIAENLCVINWAAVSQLGLVSRAKMGAVTQIYNESFAVVCRGPFQEMRALSGGNQQKVAVARIALADVDVVLLIEPTRGVDIDARYKIWRFIHHLASKGKAVVVATTDIAEALALGHEVIVMRRGHLLGKQPASQVTPEQIMIQATGGIQ